jgi:hypothetical protein
MALSNMLDGVNAALAGLAASFTVAGIFLRDGNGNQFSVELPLPTNAVQNLLTNRQTALQNQLAAMGIT